MSRPGDSIGVKPLGLEHEEKSASQIEQAAPDRKVVIGIAILTAIFAAGLLAYDLRYGRNLFYWDDFELVFGLTGQQPTDLRWFFTWQNEHLVALVRAVFFVVWKLTGDTRVMMLLISAGLVVATAFLLDVVRSLRGRAAWTDATIPLLLLNWGHYQNLLFPLQFFFVWSVALACACLWAFVRARDGWSRLELATVLLAMPLLPLNGIIGALFAIPFVLLAIRAALERALSRDRHARRDAIALGTAALVTIGTLILNLSGARRMEHHPPADSIAAVFSSISEVLAVSIGPSGIPAWPASGIAIGIVALAAGLVLLLSGRSSDSDRRAIEACGASLAGFAALVCAIGYGRAGLGPTVAFASRYSVFSGALLCVATLVLSIYARRRFGRIAATAILTIAIAAQPLAFSTGRDYGREMATVSDRILADFANGVPIEVVAHRDGLKIYPSSMGLTKFFRALADSGQGAIGRRIHGIQPCDRQVPLTPAIEVANSMAWSGAVAECSGEDPYTVFQLPAPARICGVRVRFRLLDHDATVTRIPMQTFWAQASRNSFTPYERTETVMVDSSAGEVQTVTFWVGDTIDRFRIDPNTRDSRFELLDLTLITQ